ncbi:MAG: helix-turn-helix transcriptional regulator [Anaerovoracaceae bacterium]|jgi:transcriptional regulator with XRE-family HTH domain|nr:helix-turn-helix transcriptional regulator [Anaerovoracaceae bacterium]
MAEQEKKTVDIGQKIYEIRKSEGLSQTEFADKFHVTRQTVSNWEHGKNYPDMETLMRISDEYGITFDELIKSDRELIRSIDRSRKVASKSIMIFALLGVIVIAAVLVKLMPGIVSKLYYDPTKIVAKAVDEDGGYYETTRLELDARVYSELYLPQFKYEFAESTPQGYGKYDFSLEESIRIEPAKEHQVFGHIARNHIQIYDPTEFRKSDAEFVRDVESDGDIKDWMREDLASLDDGKRYIAYVTLNEDMDYEDACKWIDQFDTGFP